MHKKIGLAICSYNRLNFLKKSLHYLCKNNFGGADQIVICDDCSTDKNIFNYLHELKERHDIPNIINESNKGVASNKNNGIDFLIESGCKHIFLMEDDILVLSKNVCREYIEYAESKNLHHMNFALHGTLNKGFKFYWRNPENGTNVAVYPDCVGAFSYYTAESLRVVGKMDENFQNAWEHVEHTYRLAKQGNTTPFWYFADHPLSAILLSEIPGSEGVSTIRSFADWQGNVSRGKEYFLKKHGEWLPDRSYSKKRINRLRHWTGKQKWLSTIIQISRFNLLLNILSRTYACFARLILGL